LPLDGNLATAHMSVAVADLGGLQSGEEHGTASPLPSLPPPPPPPRYKPEWLVRFLEKTSHEREEKKLEMKPQETGSLRAKYTALFQESKKGILNNKTIINNLRYATIWVYLEEEERLNYRVATGELSARHKLDNKERKTRSSEDHEATMSWLKRRRVELVNTPGRHETELIETEGQGSKETKKKLVPVWDLVDKVIECHEASGHYGREATFQHAKLIYAGNDVSRLKHRHAALSVQGFLAKPIIRLDLPRSCYVALQLEAIGRGVLGKLRKFSRRGRRRRHLAVHGGRPVGFEFVCCTGSCKGVMCRALRRQLARFLRVHALHDASAVATTETSFSRGHPGDWFSPWPPRELVFSVATQGTGFLRGHPGDWFQG